MQKSSHFAAFCTTAREIDCKTLSYEKKLSFSYDGFLLLAKNLTITFLHY